MYLRELDAGAIFRLVSIEDGIALVVASFADQPAEAAARVVGVDDARRAVLAVQCEYVIPRNGAPMCVAVRHARPALDTSEQALDSRAVALNLETRHASGVFKRLAVLLHYWN